MRISFNLLAERELNDAAQDDDLESPGLGETFVAEVERSCHAVAESVGAVNVVDVYLNIPRQPTTTPNSDGDGSSRRSKK